MAYFLLDGQVYCVDQEARLGCLGWVEIRQGVSNFERNANRIDPSSN